MADIPLTEITTNTLNGSGIFDKLMNAVELHIEDQYKNQRLKGTDYATVYLGAMQSVLSQSVAFALGKQQADKQADLTAEQIALVLEQIAASQANTIRENAESAKKVNLYQEQIEKTNAEELLLGQKAATEEAQTLSTTTYGSTPGPVLGVVDKQKGLLQQQTDGFIRDAEQKAAKIFMDNYAIRRSTDSLEIPPTKAANTSIDNVLLTLAGGIGTDLPNTFTVSGTITGVALADGLVISNNGGDDLVLSAGATAFTFDTALISGGTYSVAVSGNSTGQTIVITNASGTSTTDITNVIITVS